MSTQIYYNGKIIASGQPVPLVGRADEMLQYGERWASQSTVTLQGILTGCTYGAIIHAQSGLISDFAKDFQSLKIVQDGATIYEKKFAWIENVRFGDSKYVGALPYTVTLKCYEENSFSGTFGVVDPSNEWSFDEQNDGRVAITHTIAARGFNTSSGASNAFENARQFVTQKTGWNSSFKPAFITGSFSDPCLQTFSEKIDRFNATYSIVENYLYDRQDSSCSTFRYTTDYQCDSLEGRATLSIKGQIDGGYYTSIADLRTRYGQINITGLAFQNVSGSDINLQYVTSGVTEDSNSARLGFEVTFDNAPSNNSGVWFDYSTNIESNDDGIARASVNGTIHGKGDLANRWAAVQSFATTVNLYALATAAFSAFGGSPALNPYPVASGVSYNQFSAELGLNASFDNRPTPANLNFREINYTYQIVNAVQKVGVLPLIKRECNSSKSYFLTDLGFYNRAQLSIEGNAKPACGKTASEVLSELKDEIETVRAQEMIGTRIVLQRHDFTTQQTAEGEQIQFSCAWTFDPSTKANSSANYATVASLAVN